MQQCSRTIILKWLYTSIFVTPYLKQFCDHIEGSWQQSLETIKPGRNIIAFVYAATQRDENRPIRYVKPATDLCERASNFRRIYAIKTALNRSFDCTMCGGPRRNFQRVQQQMHANMFDIFHTLQFVEFMVISASSCKTVRWMRDNMRLKVSKLPIRDQLQGTWHRVWVESTMRPQHGSLKPPFWLWSDSSRCQSHLCASHGDVNEIDDMVSSNLDCMRLKLHVVAKVCGERL